MNGAQVDVGREHAPVERAGGGDGEYAAAGPEVEDAQNTPPLIQRLAEPIECQEAAAGSAVMAGAECKRRLDFDADAVCRNSRAVMGTMHDKAAGSDRSQASQAVAHPVRGLDEIEMQRLGLRGAGKSTLGQALARSLRRPLVELDKEIEHEAGISLSEVFLLYGQAGYRRIERRCLERIIDSQDDIHGYPVVAQATQRAFNPGDWNLEDMTPKTPAALDSSHHAKGT